MATVNSNPSFKKYVTAFYKISSQNLNVLTRSPSGKNTEKGWSTDF